MILTDYLTWIYQAVNAQKRRTLLTVFGFSVGISAVILLNAIGESLRQYILQEFTQFGSHIVAVMPGKTETFGVGGLLNTVRPLTLDDAISLKHLPASKYVVPVVMGTAQIKWYQRGRYTNVAGITSPALNAWQLTMDQGKFLPPDDLLTPRSFAVLGASLKQELFANNNAIGEKIHVGSHRFRIIGVLKEKGEFMGTNLDDMVYIPAAKALRLFNRNSLMEIDIFYHENITTEKFSQQVSKLLISRHNSEDFTLITQDDMLKSLDKILRFVKYAAAGLGVISLLVGAVGIITILTITVTERSQEIGLLRVLGFSSAHIRYFFIGEAIIIALISGILGYIISMTLLFIAKLFLPTMPIVFEPLALILALIISIVIGALAGWQPASKAAKLEPVLALRAE
ncbi:MAG: ABC transporter permease [Colwellia sp.]|nr:ABC transporter permease [Colwellia sp.]